MATIDLSKRKEPVIATKHVVVKDDLGRNRKVFAGQEIPGNLLDAYRDKVKETKAEKEPETNKAQLEPEVDKAQKAPEAEKIAHEPRTRKRS